MLLFIVIVIHVPLPIRREIVALEISFADPGLYEERTVLIRGWFRRRFFSGHAVFNGTIQITGYSETYGISDTVNLHPAQRAGIRIRSGWLIYPAKDRPVYIPDTDVRIYAQEPFGVLYTRSVMREAVIIVSSEGLISSTKSPVIVFNATARSDAIYRVFRFGLLPYFPE